MRIIMKNRNIILFYMLASLFFSKEGFCMENSDDEPAHKARKSPSRLQPYHDDFPIGKFSQKYSVNDLIGYTKNTTSKPQAEVIFKVSSLKKIWKFFKK